MKVIRADEVVTTDEVRWGNDAFYREVTSVRRNAQGEVLIEVSVGALVEQLPPLNPTTGVEIA